MVAKRQVKQTSWQANEQLTKDKRTPPWRQLAPQSLPVSCRTMAAAPGTTAAQPSARQRRTWPAEWWQKTATARLSGTDAQVIRLQ